MEQGSTACHKGMLPSERGELDSRNCNACYVMFFAEKVGRDRSTRNDWKTNKISVWQVVHLGDVPANGRVIELVPLVEVHVVLDGCAVRALL